MRARAFHLGRRIAPALLLVGLVPAAPAAQAFVGDSATCVSPNAAGMGTGPGTPPVHFGGASLTCSGLGPLGGVLSTHAVSWMAVVQGLAPTTGCDTGVGTAQMAVDGVVVASTLTYRFTWPTVDIVGSIVYEGRAVTVTGHLVAHLLPTPCTAGSGSASALFTFVDAGVAVSPPLATDWAGSYAPSTTCTGTVLLDGYPGPVVNVNGQPTSMYVFLQLDSAGTKACYRFHDGTVPVGGALVLRSLTGSLPPAPFTDGGTTACANTPGNNVPGPHPLLSGFLGDPEEPTYIPYLIDTYADGGWFWVCLTAGTTSRRVGAFYNVSLGLPQVTVYPDVPWISPPPPVTPPAYGSASCRATGTEYVNLTVATAHLWLASSSGAGPTQRYCVRIGGAANVGGYLSVPWFATSGLTQGADLGNCTSTVVHNTSPVALDISRSPNGASPVSLCVTVQGTTHRLSSSTTTGPAPTWTPDPGTPG